MRLRLYGSKDFHFPLGIGVPVYVGKNIREYQHIVKVGFNYKFDGMASVRGKVTAPVAAKY